MDFILFIIDTNMNCLCGCKNGHKLIQNMSLGQFVCVAQTGSYFKDQPMKQTSETLTTSDKTKIEESSNKIQFGKFIGFAQTGSYFKEDHNVDF